MLQKNMTVIIVAEVLSMMLINDDEGDDSNK